MGDLKTRLSSVRAKILRRPSVISTTSSASSSARDLRFGASHSHEPAHPSPFSRSRAVDGEADGQATRNSRKEGAHVEASKGRTETLSSQHTQRPATPTQSAARPTNEPLPQASRELTNQGASTESTGQAAEASSKSEAVVPDSTPPQDPSAPKRPREGTVRQQSLVPHTQTRLVEALLNSSPQKDRPTTSSTWDNFQSAPNLALSMVSRKIWVKRPGASATMVTIHEEDLVDDVRDMVLRKYGNSLGRSFDSPDVTLRICPREGTQHNPQEGERVLGPEEAIARTLDSYYPGGQTVDEALIIDVPQRRTPRPSPRANHPMPYYSEDLRPPEAGTEYFPPMPATAAIPSPHLPPPLTVSSVNNAAGSHHPAVHSISVLNTGQVPLLPSPGSRPGPRHRVPRPGYGRQHTASPTIISSASPAAVTNGTTPHPRQSRSRVNSLASESTQGAPAAPPLPSPPVPEAPHRLATPPPQRVASPRPPAKSKKSRKGSEHPTLPAGLLDGAVPPINVLIVEDNIINLKILEVFMKRLKVRWQTAMNGREAVNKWRTGGFHLVLMDIQLPVMNGLEATREIRRLERLNNIGVFSSSASSSAPENLPGDAPNGDDRLTNTVLFKSPVIIVALTASSLQSDRHEALAAGCNDFLTKPVNFVWLERKVMEWGCMQALIDFDGWRKWKDFSEAAAADAARSKSQSPSTSRKAKRSSLARAATPVNLSAGAGTGAGAGSSGVSSPSPSGLQGGGTVMSAAPQTQVAPAQPMLQPSQRVPDMTLTNATSTPGDDSGPPAVAAPVSTVDGTDAGTAPNGVDAAATHAVAPVAAPAAFPDSTIGL